MKILCILQTKGGQEDIGVLAEESYIQRQTMTYVLDTMEKDGWVERKKNATDRRKISINFTPSGQEVNDALTKKIMET